MSLGPAGMMVVGAVGMVTSILGGVSALAAGGFGTVVGVVCLLCIPISALILQKAGQMGETDRVVLTSRVFHLSFRVENVMGVGFWLMVGGLLTLIGCALVGHIYIALLSFFAISLGMLILVNILQYDGSLEDRVILSRKGFRKA